MSSTGKKRELSSVEAWMNNNAKKLVFGRSYKWTIKGYSTLKKGVDEEVVSETFSVGDNDETRWCSRFTPGGRTNERACYASLHLVGCKLPGRVAVGKFRFSCLDNRGAQVAHGCESEYMRFSLISDVSVVFTDGKTFDEGMKHIGREFQDDELQLVWEIMILKPEAAVFIPRIVKDEQFEVLDALEENLLNAKDAWDTTLSVKGGRSFQVHRAILSARSPVFREMLEEKRAVEIEAFGYDIMKEVILYMYTGRMSDMKGIAIDVYKAADKFELEGLKAICEEFLCDTEELTYETAPECLRIAFRSSGGNKLKRTIVSFMKSNLRQVQRTCSWKELVHDYPDIVGDMFCFAAEKF